MLFENMYYLFCSNFTQYPHYVCLMYVLENISQKSHIGTYSWLVLRLSLLGDSVLINPLKLYSSVQF